MKRMLYVFTYVNVYKQLSLKFFAIALKSPNIAQYN